MNYRYFGGTLEGSDFPYIHALGTTFVNNVGLKVRVSHWKSPSSHQLPGQTSPNVGFAIGLSNVYILMVGHNKITTG